MAGCGWVFVCVCLALRISVKCVLKMNDMEIPCGEEAVVGVSGIMLSFVLQCERLLVSCSILASSPVY